MASLYVWSNFRVSISEVNQDSLSKMMSGFFESIIVWTDKIQDRSPTDFIMCLYRNLISN